MVWGAISGISGKHTLFFWDKSWGKINAINYTDRILISHLVPIYEQHLQSFGHPICVMEDKAPPHAARHTKAAQVQHNISSLDWPASSPDLNPIEEVWRRMKGHIYRMEERPTTVPGMTAAVQEAWEFIPDLEIRHLVDSMPERVQAVIEAQGGHTRF